MIHLFLNACDMRQENQERRVLEEKAEERRKLRTQQMDAKQHTHSLRTFFSHRRSVVLVLGFQSDNSNTSLV